MNLTARELRVSVRGLTPGMFVSRLDRPWIETDFPMEGVRLEAPDSVRKLQAICAFVYVDTALGKAPEPRYLTLEPEREAPAAVVRIARDRDELADARKNTWAIEREFKDELKDAAQAYNNLEKRFQEVMDDLRRVQYLDLERLKHGVSAMVASILRNPFAFVWLKEIKRRDSYAYQHALGCALWAASFGRHLGLDKSDLHELALGGLLCDVGKTRIPMDLLARQTSLSADEVQLIRRHVEHSLELVERTPGLSKKLVEMVATHHERHDGSGYPNGLSGSEIPLFGRIMGIVDSYDAMVCVRPYVPSNSPHKAVTDLYEHRGTLFQAELVEQFIQTCGIYPTGSLVELSSGEVGVVSAVHSLKRLRPTVMVLLDRNKTPLRQFRTLDLAVVDKDDRGQPLSVKCGLPSGAFGIKPRELFLD
ncbi:HD-GYP domain-containing protein [Tahibacter amnicola]|uniref:HD-GYP domain-containing protein n=1 Tax=Tahibacter amnicola TaxID=2976241 RepID=A0ABY6BEZ4_9GAMM|nr:HD-GYP domain-containing protein [Tahibacter amnicola]UXI68161.1 HD-GYP domain-containing protein [Tahibacter amnicola]